MRFPLSQAFKGLSKDDKEKLIKSKQAAAEYRQKMKELGSACLADPKFQKYKEAYQMLERLTFDQVRNYKNPDPIQYAMTISNMLTELNTFEALITDVETDASKKVEAPKK